MAETQPLLSDDDVLFQDEGTQSNKTLPSSGIAHRIQAVQKTCYKFVSNPTNRLVACAFMAYLLSEYGLLTLQIPCSRLFEQILCRQYYRKHPIETLFGSSQEIDERLCKIHPIQSQVATLAGWRDSFLAIPSILTAVFYGSLADRYGRKPILLLSGLGELLVVAWIVFVCYFDNIFPIKLAWASAVFIFIGGGQRVLVGMLFTMITDATDKTHRTRYMYVLSTGPYVAGLITPAAEAATMSVSVWLPFIVAISAYAAMILMIFFVMLETKQEKKDQSDDFGIEGLDSQPLTEDEANPVPSVLGPVATMLKIPNLAICFVLFFIKRTSFMSENLFYQYASARFDLELRQTPWFRSVKSAGGLLMLVLVLPTITTFFIRRGTSSPVIDLRVIRGSLVAMVVAFFSVYVATSPWLFAAGVLLCGAGDGIDPGIQGLASTFVEVAHRAKMFTLLAMIDAAGKIIGGPLMAALYGAGMDSAGHSAGICFLVASLLFGAGLLLSWGIRL